MLVTISGASTSGPFTSSESSSTSSGIPGVHAMATAPSIGGKIKGSKHNFDWDASRMCETIELNLKEDPCQPVVIIGHSLGGAEAIHLAKELKEKDICVDLLVMLESVGFDNETTPDNVKKGVNIFDDDASTFPPGEEQVDGSINIPFEGSGHKEIDDEEGSGTAKASTDFEGKTSWEVVAAFVKDLPKSGCNCDQALGKWWDYEHVRDILTRMAVAQSPVSLREFHQSTSLKAKVLLPTVSRLVKMDVLERIEDDGGEARYKAGPIGRLFQG